MHVAPGSSLHIALVGASGRVGRGLARLLAGADVRFRALVEDPIAATQRLGPHAEAIGVDLRERASLERSLLGSERVFLSCDEPALLPTAITAARRAGARRVVMLSQAAGEDRCADDHGDAERALRESGLAYTVLRPTMLMQTLADVLALTTNGDVMRLPAADARIALVDARDVAAVALHAMVEDEHEGRCWRVTGPAALGMADVSEIVSHALGRAFRYLPVPVERAEDELRAAGVEHASEAARAWALVRSGALAEITDVVASIGRVEPRTFARFAATHAWKLDRGP